VKKAVQFGAGNIGRGFLGQLFSESGFETVFVDVAEDLVGLLNARGEYPLRIIGERSKMVTVRNVRAVRAADREAVARELAGADIAATAVGVNVMDSIAASLAAGFALRFREPECRPLDVIVCENLLGAGPFMRAKVKEHLDPALHAVLDAKAGFVEASIGRMVPVMTDRVRAEDPLLIEVEAYCDLPVDAEAFRGPVPDIVHLQPLPRFSAYVERKLFVHNCGHAAAAYLGYRRGCEYIWQAMADPEVAAVVRGAMRETCEALARKHGLDRKGLTEHADDLARRFANRALGDQVSRVARDPVRKLGPNDRLVGALRLCVAQGVAPRCVLQAIAAALAYDAPDDPAAARVQGLLRHEGIESVLTEICGLPGDSTEAALIREAYAASVARR
jgi:mannitol-1-phosphate 5-dehydrogenase